MAGHRSTGRPPALHPRPPAVRTRSCSFTSPLAAPWRWARCTLGSTASSEGHALWLSRELLPGLPVEVARHGERAEHCCRHRQNPKEREERRQRAGALSQFCLLHSARARSRCLRIRMRKPSPLRAGKLCEAFFWYGGRGLVPPVRHCVFQSLGACTLMCAPPVDVRFYV